MAIESKKDRREFVASKHRSADYIMASAHALQGLLSQANTYTSALDLAQRAAKLGIALVNVVYECPEQRSDIEQLLQMTESLKKTASEFEAASAVDVRRSQALVKQIAEVAQVLVRIAERAEVIGQQIVRLTHDERMAVDAAVHRAVMLLIEKGDLLECEAPESFESILSEELYWKLKSKLAEVQEEVLAGRRKRSAGIVL